MRCLYCESETAEEARFCTTCGTPVLRCPVCQNPVLADAIFCGQCGESLRGHQGLHEKSDVVLSRITQPLVRRNQAQRFADELRPHQLGVLYRPSRVAQRYALVNGDNIVGANPRNDVVIGDPEISWNHCLVTCRAQRVLVQDTASTNGTFLNDVRVTRSTPFTVRDTLRLASIELALWLAPDYERRWAEHAAE